MCRRHVDGHVVALTRQVLSDQEVKTGGWEIASSTDPSVQDFLRDVSSKSQLLSQTDASLARVLEDLIDVLINRGLIQFTDLPEAAQAKLLDRRQTRASMVNRLELLSDDTDSLRL
jgi:hypothetical protein